MELKMTKQTTGLLNITEAQQKTMENAVKKIEDETQRLITQLKGHSLYSDAKWSIVEEIISVKNPYADAPKSKKKVCFQIKR